MTTHWFSALKARLQEAHEDGDAQWFGRYARPILFTVIGLACVGVYLACSTPISVFPQTDFPRIIVGIDNGVTPIEQMEVSLTRPVEEAVNSVPGLHAVRSTTSRGSAEVSLYFDWSVDMFQTLQRVDAALAHAQSSLPPGAKITSERLTFASFPVLGYSLTSETTSPSDLWELANYQLKPQLSRLNGVASVTVQGGERPEAHIEPSPERMLLAGVTVSDILEAVRRSDQISSPGLYEQNHQLVLALVSGQAQQLDELGAIVIKTTPAGAPVRIRDVAEVKQGATPQHVIVSADGRPAVLLNICQQPQSNTLLVAAETRIAIEQMRRSLPKGVRLETFYDQSTLVSSAIGSVRDAMLIGVILAALIMILFLRDAGASIVSASVIPATILITVIALKLMGQSFNLMTLGGMAAAVGLVLDDAIVVVENIARHRSLGEARAQAVSAALREILAPLIGSTITPVVVFAPLAIVSGVTGVFFRALAITVAVALFTSLALALSWTPVLAHLFIANHSAATQQTHAAGRAMGRVIDFYERCLRWAMLHPRRLALACFLMLATSFGAYYFVGSDMLPEMDEGGFVLDYLTPPGSSLSESNRSVAHIERLLRATPEVESISRRTGLQLGLAAVTEANRGDISVKLKSKRSRGVDEIMSDLRQQITQSEPAVDIEFTQTMQDMIGDLTGSPEPIEIKLYSDDQAVLAQWAPRVADAIRKIKGVVDVKSGLEEAASGPSTIFRIDQQAASREGFTPESAAVNAAALVDGVDAQSSILRNSRVYPIRVRYNDSARASLQAMRDALLVAPNGRASTLGSLAEVIHAPEGQTEIRRENLQRYLAVTARLEDRDLGGGVRDVQSAVNSLHLPSAVRVVYGGSYEQQQQSFADLLRVLALAIALVFLALLFEFRTFAAPTAILASAMLSLSGVFFALFLTQTTLNIASFMGLIMVVGVVAKNGILLLDAAQKYRAEGMSADEAAIHAGRQRLRPIVMTALAAIAGMAPLALGLGAGAQMLQPLAIAVIGGVFVSLALSLIVTPTIHYFATRRS